MRGSFPVRESAQILAGWSYQILVNSVLPVVPGRGVPRNLSEDSDSVAVDCSLVPVNRVRPVQFAPEQSKSGADDWVQTEEESGCPAPLIVDFSMTFIRPILVFENCRFSFDSILLLIGQFLPHVWLALVGLVVLAGLVGTCYRESFWTLGLILP